MLQPHLITLVLLILTAAANFAPPFTGRTPATLPKSSKALRVMTYNIHVGVGMDKKLDLQRIADVIKQEKPDLVGLQEVDRGVKRTEGKDEIAELAKMTRMHSAFAHNIDYQGGQYGVAILSRYPITRTDHRKYENKRVAERRGMLRVEVNVAGRTLNFVTTHLDYQYADSRLFETEQLLKFLEGVKGPLIVTGDFNDEPTGSSYQLMLNGYEDSWMSSRARGDGFSYPADKPVKRIDYIFTAPRGIKTKRAWIVNTLASDHLPLVVEVEIRWEGLVTQTVSLRECCGVIASQQFALLRAILYRTPHIQKPEA